MAPVGGDIVFNGLGRGGAACFRFGEAGGDPVLVEVPFLGGEPVRVVFVVLELGLTGLIVGILSNLFNALAGR